ncbi:MAG: helix-turn-helix domain-containing protein [Clostridia bacterium]|nr:helix-turn-helix domain-containing protein [Clostridia bacterium]
MEIIEFGANLAKKRAEAHLSAYELSLRIGKDASYIHKVESGKINVSLKSILKICEVLEIEPIELFKSK